MPMWKIRVVLSDDEHSYDALRGVLASYEVTSLRLRDRGRHLPGTTGELVIALPDNQPIGELLHALHEISPQVLISRADTPQLDPAASADPHARRFHHNTAAIGRALSQRPGLDRQSAKAAGDSRHRRVDLGRA